MERTGIPNQRPIIIWLCAGLLMLIIQILLGGITRLTGSGLSITEWKPLLGAIPPLSEKEWEQSFDKYQQIAQFKQLNSHFSLSDYKGIFFWEWFHREWARLIGLVFIIPFAGFVIRKRIEKQLILPLFILFLLGALQGLVGWVMVKSGLNDTALVVSHIRLAIHFISALVLVLYLLWFILKLSVSSAGSQPLPGIQKLNVILLVLVSIQMLYGALMAGSHAALYAVTFPDMNGAFLPSGTSFTFSEMLNNPLTIQFIHRMLAYGIGFIILIWFIQVSEIKRDHRLYQYRWIPLTLVIIQVLLGVFSLLNSVNSSLIYYAVLHQFVGILLFMALFVAFYFSKRRT